MNDPFIGIFHKGISDMIMENATFSVRISFARSFGKNRICNCRNTIENINYKYIDNYGDLRKLCIEHVQNNNPWMNIISINALKSLFYENK